MHWREKGFQERPCVNGKTQILTKIGMGSGTDAKTLTRIVKSTVPVATMYTDTAHYWKKLTDCSDKIRIKRGDKFSFKQTLDCALVPDCFTAPAL